MKSQMNRKTFLQATLATSLAGLVACSGEGEDPAGGDGDGDMGSGGAGTGGAGTGGAGTGGSNTGGAGTGGSSTGGAGTGGSDVGAGGSDVGAGGSDVGAGGSDVGAGGSDVGTGGAGTGGEAAGACATVMTEWLDNHPAEFGLHDYDEMEVSPADVAAGVEKVYSVQGASQHPHTLTVTAANFATLAADGMVTVTTSEDNGHDHQVTLVCNM